MSNVLDWNGEDAKVTLYLIAGRLFGPEFAAKGGYTSDDLISAATTAMDVYLNISSGVNYLLPKKL